MRFKSHPLRQSISPLESYAASKHSTSLRLIAWCGFTCLPTACRGGSGGLRGYPSVGASEPSARGLQ